MVQSMIFNKLKMLVTCKLADEIDTFYSCSNIMLIFLKVCWTGNFSATTHIYYLRVQKA